MEISLPLAQRRRTRWLSLIVIALVLWPQMAASQCATMVQPAQLGVTNKLSSATDRLKIQGSFVLPNSTFAALNPLINGATLEVDDGTSAAVIIQTLPAGAYDPDTKMGWSQNDTQTHWLFRNNNPGAPETNGIRRFALTDLSDTQANLVQTRVVGARGDYPVEGEMVLPFNAKVTVDNSTGDCGETGFLDADCRGRSSPAVSFVHCGR
jgi:hypothetical protein